MKIAYMNGENLIVKVYTDEKYIDDGLNYIEVPSNITAHEHSWYIEDGEIKIDQQKLIEFNRQNMPNLTKREFRKKLRDAQLFDSVEAYVKAGDGYLQDAWEYADYFARLDPFILKAIEVLELDPVMVDTLWESK